MTEIKKNEEKLERNRGIAIILMIMDVDTENGARANRMNE